MMFHTYPILLMSIALALAAGASDARELQFTTEQATDADVTVSPDGKQLVCTVLGHLFRLSVTGGDAEQLTFGACYDSDPAYSPDGRTVAFVSDRDAGGGNVFVLDLTTKNLTQVTRETQTAQPTWSPDGKTLFHLRYLPREDDPRRASLFSQPALCDLRRIRLDGEGQPEIVRGAGLIRSVFHLAGGRPAWTVLEQDTAGGPFARSVTHIESLDPVDGKVVKLRSVPGDLGFVVASAKGDGVYCRSGELQFVPLREDGENRPSGRRGGAVETGFAMSRDGNTAYLSSGGRIVQIAVDSGKRQVVDFRAQVTMEVADPPESWSGTSRPRAILNPELAPDGQSLVFAAAGRLWRQSLDGKPARRLLKEDGWAREPALSPDGRQLAFAWNQKGKRELRLLDLETGSTRSLVDLGQGARARFSSWSGDGKRIVFQKSGALSSPFEIVAVDVTSGATEKLTSVAGDWSSRPHFTPGDDGIYFTSRTSNSGNVFRLRLMGDAQPEAVTHLQRHVREALVSPDGRWLALRRNTEIWAAPLGATPIREHDLKQLSREGGGSFSFTRDSSAVIYSAGDRVWRQAIAGDEREEIPIRLEWPSPAAPPLLIKRVRVLDFTAGKFGDETALLVEDGEIRWIGSEQNHTLPDGVVILDAVGKYAIPGLFDFHAHAAWANYEADTDVFIAYGVTSVRDTGGSLETLSALADRGDTSGDPVPRYFFSGEIFEGPQPIWGDAFSQVYTAEEARDLVRLLKRRGAHFIKVYPSLPAAIVRAVVEEARRQGLPVVGHGLNLEEIVKHVTLGFVSLEHCPLTLSDDLRQMLVASGTRCDPTLAILGGHSNLFRREPRRLNDQKLRTFFSDAHIKAASGGGFAPLAANWPNRLAELHAGYRAGIRLQAGTDSLMPGTFFGASLHWELEHLSEAGLRPIEVLRMATADAAAAVGAGDCLGTITAGKLADMVLLDADPLNTIANTQAIWRVVKGGWVFDPNELRATKP